MVGQSVEKATGWVWLRFPSFLIVSSLQLFLFGSRPEGRWRVTSAQGTHLSTRKLWNRAFVSWGSARVGNGGDPFWWGRPCLSGLGFMQGLRWGAALLSWAVFEFDLDLENGRPVGVGYLNTGHAQNTECTDHGSQTVAGVFPEHWPQTRPPLHGPSTPLEADFMRQ